MPRAVGERLLCISKKDWLSCLWYVCQSILQTQTAKTFRPQKYLCSSVFGFDAIYKTHFLSITSAKLCNPYKNIVLNLY